MVFLSNLILTHKADSTELDSRFLDLDPNNIESVNVLKGLAASTYGAQGKNGVIVITTKSGSLKPKGPKKTEITVSQSYFVNEIASMPDYQNEYGGGFDQSYELITVTGVHRSEKKALTAGEMIQQVSLMKMVRFHTRMEMIQ